MMSEYAPVGVTVYTRVSHLKECIASLAENPLARETQLYVFSDGPQAGDEEAVKRVRDYLKTIRGFKKVNVVNRDRNFGYDNVTQGLNTLLEQYKRVVWMEDDNIVSRHFLSYMNQYLTQFRHRQEITAICGFNTPQEKIDATSPGIFLSKLYSAWGFATWHDRGFVDIIANNQVYLEFAHNKKLREQIRRVHPTLCQRLKWTYKENRFAGDYFLVYDAIKNDRFFIKPFRSLVRNIGHDGSGMHCGITDKFMFSSIDNDPATHSQIVEQPEYRPDLDKQTYDFHHPSRFRILIKKARDRIKS